MSKQIYQGAKSIQAQKTSFNWKVAAVLIPLIGLSTYVSFQQELMYDKYANYAYLNPFKEKLSGCSRTMEVKEKIIELKKPKSRTTPKTVVETVKANTEVKAKKTITAPSVKTTLLPTLSSCCRLFSEHNATN